jgi:hypothetical protein
MTLKMPIREEHGSTSAQVLHFQLNPDMEFLIQADVPVQRKVNGFQLMPTYILLEGESI